MTMKTETPGWISGQGRWYAARVDAIRAEGPDGADGREATPEERTRATIDGEVDGWLPPAAIHSAYAEHVAGNRESGLTPQDEEEFARDRIAEHNSAAD